MPSPLRGASGPAPRSRVIRSSRRGAADEETRSGGREEKRDTTTAPELRTARAIPTYPCRRLPREQPMTRPVLLVCLSALSAAASPGRSPAQVIAYDPFNQTAPFQLNGTASTGVPWPTTSTWGPAFGNGG